MPQIKKTRSSFYGITLIPMGNFNISRFSFWKIEYEKCEGEGKLLYMTNNLANGFV